MVRLGHLLHQKRLARRQTLEESGLEIEIGQPFHTGYFMMPRDVTGRQRRNAGKRTFLIYFTARYISGEVRLSDEHDGFVWVDKSNYRSLINDKLGNTTKTLEVYFAAK